MGYTRIGNWLLLSLIPSAILGVVFFVIYIASFVSDANNELDTVAEGISAMLWVVACLYWWFALFAGIVLKIVGSRQTSALEEESVAYAETRNWQQITKTSWKKFMRNGIVFSVSTAYRGRTWNMSIEGDGEHLAMSGFDRPRLALQFADSMWERVIAKQSTFNPEEVRRSREWQDGALQLTEGRA